MKSILDPDFKYTPSHKTDIRKTFRKARMELEQQGAEQRETEAIQVEVDRVDKVIAFRHRNVFVKKVRP